MGANAISWAPLLAIGLLAALAFLGTRRGVLAQADGDPRLLHSNPGYYGLYGLLWAVAPPLLFWSCWIAIAPALIESRLLAQAHAAVRGLDPEPLAAFFDAARMLSQEGVAVGEITPELEETAARHAALTVQARRVLFACVVLLGAGGWAWARSRVQPSFRAREGVERVVNWLLLACSSVAVVVTAGIVLSLIFESARFFARVPVMDFLLGLQWSPQTPLRADQVGSSGSFGMLPVFAGTLLITLIAMAVAVPIGLFAAIYLAEYAGPRARTVTKPLLEILAGIPTVVYGFFAALSVGPWVRGIGESLGFNVASESALAAGAVMGVMIVPFVSSLSDDVINAVPQSLRDGSLGLGATQAETIRLVVLPAALPGIMAAVLLAVSRAIGETMIVVMAAGLAANLTANPFEAVTTVTVQIVTLLVGDQEFDSAKTLAAFALGLVLFVVTLCLNVVALIVVRRYREIYD